MERSINPLQGFESKLTPIWIKSLSGFWLEAHRVISHSKLEWKMTLRVRVKIHSEVRVKSVKTKTQFLVDNDLNYFELKLIRSFESNLSWLEALEWNYAPLHGRRISVNWLQCSVNVQVFETIFSWEMKIHPYFENIMLTINRKFVHRF